jgi:hypothetical protein
VLLEVEESGYQKAGTPAVVLFDRDTLPLSASRGLAAIDQYDSKGVADANCGGATHPPATAETETTTAMAAVARRTDRSV